MKYSHSYDKAPAVPVAIGCTIVITCLAIFAIRWMAPTLAKLSTPELIAIVAVLATAVQISVQILLHSIEFRISKKTRIGLQARVEGGHARISCSFECLGRRRIIPKNIYLFLEKGISNGNGLYEFPYLLKHEEGECDCILSKRCKHGGISEFPMDLVPERLRTGFAPIVVTMKHLSSESILFMDPGEHFSEDVMLELSQQGVYRATLVFTATNADCICTTRQFLVSDGTPGLEFESEESHHDR